MFGAAHSLQRELNSFLMRPGDVTYERRFIRREWFIVVEKRDGNPVGECVYSHNQGRVGQRFSVSGTKLCNDPDKWPDEVCTAVAKWRLTDG